MVFVDFKRLKSPTTWHRTIQFRLALSPQNSLGFQSQPDITMHIKSKPVSSIKFCLARWKPPRLLFLTNY